MDGKNCNGRRISLLNDSCGDVAVPAFPSKIQLPPLTAHHSRASSATSTPSLSPAQTPSLVRSSSSDSRAFSIGTPSPLTPSYSSFDHPAVRHYSSSTTATTTIPTTSTAKPHRSQSQAPATQHYYILNNYGNSKMDDHNVSMYPPLPDTVAPGMPAGYPMPQQLVAPQTILPQTQQPTGSNSPASEPSRVSTVSAQSSTNNSNNKGAQPKKNQYPCPMAKQVGCTDFFTTSGHAARHAKKHTGKKDAFCPECNKAFTRKDNMEQHRRTHQNGRGTSRANNEDSKIKKTTKQPAKKSTLKVEPQLEAAVQQELADQAEAASATQQIAQAAQGQAPVQTQPPSAIIPQLTEDTLLIPAGGGTYFLNAIDAGPVPALPMAMPELNTIRPPLHRASFANSLDYVAPGSQIIDPDTLHYSYPSPGLSNGLNSLALAASEHRRMSEKDRAAQSPSSESSSQETPSRETP